VDSQSLSTVYRVMRLLFFLAEHGPATIPELAAHFALPRSTAYRYVAALKASGMANEVSDNRYTLGPRCVQLEAAFQRAYEVTNPHHSIMERLARETGETVALVIPLGSQAVCVDTIECPLPLRYAFTKGAVKPLLRGASAKALLPYLPQGWVAGLIDEATDLNNDQKRRLRAELPAIREQGYAVSLGEVDAGVWAVGAPVFREDGSLECSLSVIAPVFRVQDREEQLIQRTISAAQRMSNHHDWEQKRAV
jgi:IclR family acetate operon transcriptional repressor